MPWSQMHRLCNGRSLRVTPVMPSSVTRASVDATKVHMPACRKHAGMNLDARAELTCRPPCNRGASWIHSRHVSLHDDPDRTRLAACWRTYLAPGAEQGRLW